jgi:GT2 family glycosyltransferase
MTASLTVSVVLYKTAESELQQLIASLKKFSGPLWVCFIDNSPVDVLRGACASCQLGEYIHLPANPGYGAANNLGIQMARKHGSRYHLVINPDIYFDSDILSPMLEYFERHPRVGQMMPKIMNPDGDIQRLCKLIPTPLDLIVRRFGTKRSRDKRNRRFELHVSGYERIIFAPYLSGCFMLLRQEALHEVGTFDERFFLYMEDIDLTRRIAAKYETLYYPRVTAFHKHRGASRKSIKMFLIHALNMVRYFNKWGWVYDPLRERLNQRTLDQFRM